MTSRERSLSNLLPTLGHHFITPPSCGFAADRSVEALVPSIRPARRSCRTLGRPRCATLISDTGSGRLQGALRRGSGGCRKTVGCGQRSSEGSMRPLKSTASRAIGPLGVSPTSDASSPVSSGSSARRPCPWRRTRSSAWAAGRCHPSGEEALEALDQGHAAELCCRAGPPRPEGHLPGTRLGGRSGRYLPWRLRGIDADRATCLRPFS